MKFKTDEEERRSEALLSKEAIRPFLRRSLNEACTMMCFLCVLFGGGTMLLLLTEIGATLLTLIFNGFLSLLHGIGILRSGH
jgi:hypothetical protein